MAEICLPALPVPGKAGLSHPAERVTSLWWRLLTGRRVVTTIAGSASPWLAYGEEVLDLEMVHVIAPDAALTVVLVKGTSLDNPGNAVAAAVAAIRLGLTRGAVISLSAAGQIGGEHCVTRGQVARVHSALQAAAARHVTVVAASGDMGAAGEPCDLIDALTWPATAAAAASSARRERLERGPADALAGAVLVGAAAGGQAELTAAMAAQGQLDGGQGGVADGTASPRRIGIGHRDRVVLVGRHAELKPCPG
jgi:hypothetical protein